MLKVDAVFKHDGLCASPGATANRTVIGQRSPVPQGLAFRPGIYADDQLTDFNQGVGLRKAKSNPGEIAIRAAFSGTGQSGAWTLPFSGHTIKSGDS